MKHLLLLNDIHVGFKVTNEDVDIEPWQKLKPNPNLLYLLVFCEGKPVGIHQTSSLLLLLSWSSHPAFFTLFLSSGSTAAGVWPHPFSASLLTVKYASLCSTSVFPRHLPLNPSSTCLSGSNPVIKLGVLMTLPQAWLTALRMVSSTSVLGSLLLFLLAGAGKANMQHWRCFTCSFTGLLSCAWQHGCNVWLVVKEAAWCAGTEGAVRVSAVSPLPEK